MVFVLFLYIILNIFSPSLTQYSNVGTSLFFRNKDFIASKCWTPKEIATLRARKIFEQMVPKKVTIDDINNKYIKQTLKYYKRAMREVEKCTNIESRDILVDALCDTLGAHMRSKLLPAVRYAYYAGFVCYRDVRRLHDFYDEIKIKLNTLGNGWKEPALFPSQSNITVGRIRLDIPAFTDPCKQLIVSRSSDSCLHLPTPKMDDEKQPTAIALPFRNTALIGLSSPAAESAVFRYYQTAAKCILHNSPQKCRHSDFVDYNSELWKWLQESVAPHLSDEKLYSAYGGILRVAASVQTYGKGLKRRNLYRSYTTAANHVPYLPNLNLDPQHNSYQFTPGDYLRYMLVLSLLIVIMQFIYHYTIGYGGGCNCRWPPAPDAAGIEEGNAFNDLNQTTTKPKITAILPQIEHQISENVSKFNRSLKSKSIGSSIHMQKVYDLNENKEKVMTFIEESDAGSLTDSEKGTVAARRTPGNPSLVIPAQLQVEESHHIEPRGRRAPPPPPAPCLAASTSTESTYKLTYMTDSDSSSSGESGSSVISLSQRLRRTKSTRDLAWARRVVTDHMIRAKILNDTSEVDCTSYTTLTSKI